MEIQEIAKQIKLVILDVDGVLSDGCINISGDGELFKSFFVRDGLGIKFLQDAGIAVAICTGRTSDIVEERARELDIKLVMQGEKDKRVGFTNICIQANVEPQNVAYMGDDIPDLCLFPLVGLACAPCDAAPIALSKAAWVSTYPGGRGAVRELAEFILNSQDKFASVVQKRFGIEI
ncbi:KdsC family phosphatase [Turicimonas muris]|uniref:KdsC family phosphatase n=1 Tax=Turicimonas muris TaxID=1796652 RepID=UPI0025A51FE6|nr:HAD-IIIA family hydrolase [Turicimonas muris]